jgi:hypothetical protein
LARPNAAIPTHPAVRAAEHPCDGDHDHLDQVVASPQGIARVFEHGKMPSKGPIEA